MEVCRTKWRVLYNQIKFKSMNKTLFNLAIIATLSFTMSSCSKGDSQDSRGMTSSSSGSPSVGGGGGTGKGGSYARFSIVNNYMYALHNNQLIVFNISDLSNPTIVRTIPMLPNREIETIFSYGNHLLFGTTNSMLVYSLSNPENPNFVSQFEHVLACDPVVAENGYAYVTLNGAAGCRGNINQLDVLDISNILQPKHLRTVTMESPKGLGIDGNTLFVCDGDFLKVYSVVSPSNPSLQASFSIKSAYDVIPHNNNLIVSSAEGIYQYDYTNPLDLKFMSLMKVEK